MAQTKPVKNERFYDAVRKLDPSTSKALVDMRNFKKEVDSTMPKGPVVEVIDGAIKGGLWGTGSGLAAQLLAKEALGPVGVIVGFVAGGIQTAVESKTDHAKVMSDWKIESTMKINKFNDARIEKWDKEEKRNNPLIDALTSTFILPIKF